MSFDDNNGGCLSPLLTLFLALFGGIAFLFTTGQPTTSSTIMQPTLALPTTTIVLAPLQGTPTDVQVQQMTAVIDQRLTEFIRIGLVDSVQQNTLDAATSTWTISFSTPPTTDMNALLSHLITPGVVELVDLSSLPSAEATALLQQQIGATYPTLLTDADFLAAAVTTNAMSGNPQLQIDFTPEGAERLATFSGEYSGAVGLVLDGLVLSTPIIQGKISTPIVLSGFEDALQLQNLASAINSDSLPFPLVIASIS